MRIKICGITQPQQSLAITQLGATALGFICVPSSPRYVSIEQINLATSHIPDHIDKIGVFANSTIFEITKVVSSSSLTGVQLHGDETPLFCEELRQVLPNIELIKAFRVRSWEQLETTLNYTSGVDTFLLDAYHPQQLGGTGKTLDWQVLQSFRPALPWFLAGGLTPDNVLTALTQIHPDGIDLSSGVERSPGDKDLDKVALLFSRINQL
ncbi:MULTISPECIES: phosphoribosylanthranilate isomerase [Cylindrospermopsis]|uniref:phosphoribosylanthranilate isomerase n=1 Tax=Cylindrospermopsis TaxID=77021 RepID=UPI000708E67A|nr:MULTISPECIES: phosphoribosylanthranilate isomerase [Cylindrospermopsis]KRH97067.1 N-(5'-phosphoribosyl)anthranilate isomerase [Cylindrospermopsis sp. CR12]MBU6343906.1 phosphoribosylanthranilate isomerase [Cyanobacteria bacterium REEB494]TPX27535.1 phosphoribosylanthranilate isomerase [Cylindrospermopsis raciborskii GIHE 2018]UJL33971.1 phosphoribosylanthranilate isomerase [Cylindrospermopsis raciborskii Cr2010]